MMQPRLYMQSFQYASYNRGSEQVTFETRHACGRRFYFPLTKNQFLALNDAILLIDSENAYGHYPLGQNTWMHYNAFDASLYREMNNGRVHFIFASFDEYKSYTHRRLLSLVRVKNNETAVAAASVARTRTRTKARAKRNGRGRRRNSNSESVITNHKRPLSVAVQSSDRSPASKRTCREKREAVSRATDNADVSYNDEESAIFSEWHYSNTRRRRDSISPLSSTKESIRTLENDYRELSCASPPSDSTVAMESE